MKIAKNKDSQEVLMASKILLPPIKPPTTIPGLNVATSFQSMDLCLWCAQIAEEVVNRMVAMPVAIAM